MSKRYWTGIGSRKNISEILRSQQFVIGTLMSSKNWTLLTGGAEGSDYNFLDGSSTEKFPSDEEAWKVSHVIRPNKYQNFKGYKELACTIEYMEEDDFYMAKAYFIRNKIFTKKQFEKMEEVVQHLHARNFFQIFDTYGKVRSEYVLYAAPENRWGIVSGGTRTAVAIARIENIPTFNLKLKGQYAAFLELARSLPNANS